MSLFYNPVTIFFGEKGRNELNNIVSELHCRRVLIVAWNYNAFEPDKIFPHLYDNKKVQKRMIEFAGSNPDINDLLYFLNGVHDYPFDFVIAIGGGSVIDIAKCLIAFQNMKPGNSAGLREMITRGEYRNGKIETPLLAIPTTSGTGSEVTSWGTIWDREAGLKYSISHKNLYAKYALILPSLTVKLPLRPTISTALDALCHAAEAYWSKQSNPVSRLFSLRAIQIIVGQLQRSDFKPDHQDIRQDLALGSVFAGLAFSNTRTTACHSISYPLTLGFGIEHGIAACLTLGKMLEINKERIVDLSELLSVFKAIKVEQVQESLVDIFKAFGIPHRLKSYGVSENDIPHIASKSFTAGRMDNNPVELAENDVQTILRSIL